MRSLPLLLLALALPGAALAQSTTATQPAPKPADGAMRDFSLRNQASRTIVEAHAQLANKGDELLTARGKITANHAQAFHVAPDQCVGHVSVKFQGGRELQADLNDCHDPMIVVHDDRIEAQSSAVPGTVVTPGEGRTGTREGS